MKYYSDEQNKAGLKVFFLLVQLVVLGVVYTILYTSLLAVKYAIAQYDVSVVMYFPVVVAMVIFPILLYKYRKMFNAGRMLGAVTWMMATASLTVLFLYLYVLQMVG